ncbi:histidine kinase [Exiguobacterium sp. KRL4]|uniref:ATP-binding protein n=1 Tax=Exiguobacterium sp. KRL4 TaxID=1914536 RepID=UPI0008F82347|nr:ATP-binding protein [Exiguobacterium sp. KRL4]OIN67278.1 histidine kinase [Exiguobacterium sp. KRL4]
MTKWIRRRIGRQLLAVFYVVLVLVSVTSFFVYDYMEERIELSRGDLEVISEQNRRADTLWDNWQTVQFGLRGFVIFGNQERFDEIQELRTEIKSETDWFVRNAKTDEEEEFAAQMTNLYDLYYSALFPLTQSYVNEKKAGTIREDFLEGDSLFSLPIAERLVEQGQLKQTADGSIDITPDIEKASSALNEYRNNLQQQQNDAVMKLRSEVAKTQWIWISSILVLVAFILLFVHPFLKRMTKQLLRLIDDNQKLSRNEPIEIDFSEQRTDEVGMLRSSFNQMAITTNAHSEEMQGKNEELQAQSEELLAQQEELQSQQEELEEAYQATKQNEEKLKMRSELTEALAVRETVESYPAIVQKMLDITSSEYGALLLYDDGTYIGTTTNGMKIQQVQALLEDDTSVLSRMRLGTQVVQSEKRVSRTDDTPYSFSTYEVALPIYDPTTNQLMAAIYMVRYQSPYQSQQLADMRDFSQQMTLSLLRTRSYDEMKQEKQKTEQVLDSIREAIIYLEDGNDELYVNRPLFELVPELQSEFTKDRTLSSASYVIEVMRNIVDDTDRFNDYLTLIRSGDVSPDKVQFDVRNNAAHLEVYAERIDIEGGWKGVILVIRDITRETEADRLKTELVSTVSHELRTPLSSIYGFTELMLNREIDTMKQRKYLATIHTETERLSNLVTDFLDVQRMQSGGQLYQMAHLDLYTIVQQVVGLYDVSNGQHEIHVQMLGTERPTIIGDEARIKQLLNNLVNNAIKYSPDGGLIEVSIGTDENDATIRITDHGIGIPHYAFSQLFDKFYRVDNSDTRRIGGTGLGLSICKEIVKEHDGVIHVESKEGQGSTFTVQLPLHVMENA